MWRKDLFATLRLAWPVMVSRAGILIMVIIDTIMSGRAGASEIAFYGVGAAPLITLMVLSVGLLVSVQIMTAQADGAGDTRRIGSILLVGIGHALVLGFVFIIVTRFSTPLLELFGQSEDIVRGAAPVMAMLGLGMPGMLIYTVSNMFLEALHRPLPGMVIMVVANIVNAGLNWFFVYAPDGPRLSGAEGVATATTVVRTLMAICSIALVWLLVDRVRYGIAPFAGGYRDIGRRIRRIGWPMALGMGLESSAFAAMTLMAGSLGAAAVAAYTIAHNFNALVFMFGLGVSTAAAVRVSNAQGRRDADGIRRAGWVACGVGVVVLALLGIGLVLGREAITSLYTNDAVVTAITLSIIPIVVVLLIPDGMQIILIGALRGANDFWSGAIAQFVGFWVVMVPTGWYFGIYRTGGVSVLMWSICLGALVSSAMVTARFIQICSNAKRVLDRPTDIQTDNVGN